MKYTQIARILLLRCVCPLLAQSGHQSNATFLSASGESRHQRPPIEIYRPSDGASIARRLDAAASLHLNDGFSCSESVQIGHDIVIAMTITVKLLAAGAVVILMHASHAKAGHLLVRGPGGYTYVSLKQRHAATRFYVRQSPDLGGALVGALAGAALQLIPRATEALMVKLPPGAPTPPATPPLVTAQAQGSPPADDVLDDIEGNSRGITRQEVEAALADWCASHIDAPLCVKLRVTPPAGRPTYQPAPPPYYLGHRDPGPRGYYRPGRFQTWNGCQSGWTVQDGLCKPYRGY